MSKISRLIVCSAVVIGSTVVSLPSVTAGVLAVSGFNDATGANSDLFLGSPFVAGVTVHNQGFGEAGWDGPWQRLGGFDDRAHVVTDYVYEGDGAVTLWADRSIGTSIERAWSSIAPKIRVDTYVLVRPAARMGGQLVRTGGGEIPTRTAGEWLINENGSISLYDVTLGSYVPTPFWVVPNEWNKYSLIADTRTQTWEFAFNDVKFQRAKPFVFRNAMSFIDRVNLIAIDTRVTYVDYVTVTEIVPSSGDVNGDGALDVEDIDELSLYVRAMTNNVGYDIDGDGSVNDQDRRVWVNSKKHTYFGDADLNGEFSSSDFVQVFAAGKYETLKSAGWAQGDWDGNALFESGDFVTAFADGGYEQGPRIDAIGVPEPRASLLAVIGLLTWLFIRR